MEKRSKSYKIKKFKISTPTGNEEFELSDWSYSLSDIEERFDYILKKWSRIQNT